MRSMVEGATPRCAGSTSHRVGKADQSAALAAAPSTATRSPSPVNGGGLRSYIRSGVWMPSSSSAVSSWCRLAAARASREPLVAASGAIRIGQAA